MLLNKIGNKEDKLAKNRLKNFLFKSIIQSIDKVAFDEAITYVSFIKILLESFV